MLDGVFATRPCTLGYNTGYKSCARCSYGKYQKTPCILGNYKGPVGVDATCASCSTCSGGQYRTNACDANAAVCVSAPCIPCQVRRLRP